MVILKHNNGNGDELIKHFQKKLLELILPLGMCCPAMQSCLSVESERSSKPLEQPSSKCHEFIDYVSWRDIL
jgi:hypothetical protein